MVSTIDSVDYSTRPTDYLADVRITEFRNDSPGIGKINESLDRMKHAADKTLCSQGIVFRDEDGYVIEI